MTERDERTGKTRLELFIEIERQTGVVAPELRSLPVVPAAARHVWDWFQDLSVARGVGMQFMAITWADMRSYFALLGVRPQRWELAALRRLDSKYLESRAGHAKGRAVSGAKQMRQSMTGKQPAE